MLTGVVRRQTELGLAGKTGVVVVGGGGGGGEAEQSEESTGEVIGIREQIYMI